MAKFIEENPGLPAGNPENAFASTLDPSGAAATPQSDATASNSNSSPALGTLSRSETIPVRNAAIHQQPQGAMEDIPIDTTEASKAGESILTVNYGEDKCTILIVATGSLLTLIPDYRFSMRAVRQGTPYFPVEKAPEQAGPGMSCNVYPKTSNTNVAVTSFLLAIALANQLEMMRDANPEYFSGFDPFITDSGSVNIPAVAQYLLQSHPARNLPRNISLEDLDEIAVDSSTKTSIVLFRLANALAKVLQQALDSGDFIACQNEETQKPEQYVLSNGRSNCAALQRYIATHVLKGVPMANQKATIVQKRLKSAEEAAALYGFDVVSEEVISGLLSGAQTEYKRIIKSMKH